MSTVLDRVEEIRGRVQDKVTEIRGKVGVKGGLLGTVGSSRGQLPILENVRTLIQTRPKLLGQSGSEGILEKMTKPKGLLPAAWRPPGVPPEQISKRRFT